MKLYNLIIISKATATETVLLHNITEAQAERECEQWGWSYNDGTHSFYMGYKESSVTTEMLETIQNSTLADLQDALEVETGENILLAIKTEIGARTNESI